DVTDSTSFRTSGSASLFCFCFLCRTMLLHDLRVLSLISSRLLRSFGWLLSQRPSRFFWQMADGSFSHRPRCGILYIALRGCPLFSRRHRNASRLTVEAPPNRVCWESPDDGLRDDECVRSLSSLLPQGKDPV